MFEASEFDIELIDYLKRVGLISADDRYLLAAGERSDLIVVGHLIIDPRKVLRHLIKGNLLGRMLDDDWDDFDAQQDVKGDFRGGRMKKRDKRFGLGDDFWDWWHRHMKQHAGGRDIVSKEEADGWNEIYVAASKKYSSSAFFLAVRSISYTEQKIARRVLLGAATDLLLQTTRYRAALDG
jgi:hypothetical protein